MKSKRVIFRIILIVSMTIIFSSCAGNLDHNWDEPEFAQLQIIPTKYFRIHCVNIHETDSTVTIQGRIEQRSVFGKRTNGHIDISIINPGGEVAAISVRPSGWRFTRRYGRRVIRNGSFHAILDLPPMKGSIIRIGFHKSIESGSRESFDCGNNITITDE